MPAIPPDDLGAALAGQVVYKREARLQEIQESARDAWIRALEMTANIARHPATTLPILVEELADKFEIAPALISERQTLSYRALADRANYYALWALRQNLAFGDVFCLLMQNSPEYFAIWLGITKVGGIVSLINTRLTARLSGPQHQNCRTQARHCGYRACRTGDIDPAPAAFVLEALGTPGECREILYARG
jgi:non-ribosomal peptide synthetase component F